MKPAFTPLAFVLIIVLALTACAPSKPQASSGDALIAVSTNFRHTFEVLEQEFERGNQHQLTLVSGATGQLYAQIINGAPYDVFLAADSARPDKLVKDGLASGGFTYAEGALVLWAKRAGIAPQSLLPLDGETVLRAGKYKTLATANPALAPYGQAAEAVLSALNFSANKNRVLVQGENVGQAFALVATGNADLGLVSRADVLRINDGQISAGVHWPIDPALYPPIVQKSVLLKRGENSAAARAFMVFLQSDEAREIIHQHGYELPDLGANSRLQAE